MNNQSWNSNEILLEKPRLSNVPLKNHSSYFPLPTEKTKTLGKTLQRLARGRKRLKP